MARINIYTEPDYTGERTLEGWFDPGAADCWEEGTRWDGSNHVSLVAGGRYAHEELYRTAGGRWVIHFWSQWEGVPETYRYVTDNEARDWLLRSEYSSEQVEQITQAEVESERGPGQPQIGAPIKATLPTEHLAIIDGMVAAGEASSRSEAVRMLVARALAR